MKIRVAYLLLAQKMSNKNTEKRLINILLGKNTQTKRDVFVSHSQSVVEKADEVWGWKNGISAGAICGNN
ncbi:MAG: hypothetical protein K2O97_03580 [Acetatifactor sp.]|nr:hypothetical protein [Acetatifactor sp.]